MKIVSQADTLMKLVINYSEPNLNIVSLSSADMIINAPSVYNKCDDGHGRFTFDPPLNWCAHFHDFGITCPPVVNDESICFVK